MVNLFQVRIARNKRSLLLHHRHSHTMPMRSQLSPTKYAAATPQAMIVRLLHAVTAFTTLSIQFTSRASFIVGYLPKSGVSNVFQLTVLTSMCHHFIGVRADEITFHAMEMRRLVVVACGDKNKNSTDSTSAKVYFSYPYFCCMHTHRIRISYWLGIA